MTAHLHPSTSEIAARLTGGLGVGGVTASSEPLSDAVSAVIFPLTMGTMSVTSTTVVGTERT